MLITVIQREKTFCVTSIETFFERQNHAGLIIATVFRAWTIFKKSNILIIFRLLFTNKTSIVWKLFTENTLFRMHDTNSESRSAPSYCVVSDNTNLRLTLQ